MQIFKSLLLLALQHGLSQQAQKWFMCCCMEAAAEAAQDVGELPLLLLQQQQQEAAVEALVEDLNTGYPLPFWAQQLLLQLAQGQQAELR